MSLHDLNSFLKEGVAVSAAGFRLWRKNRLQSLLVVAEIALALVLQPPPGPGKPPTPYLYARIIDVSPHYFQTMQIPVRQGREFNGFDIDRSMPVTLINETMARRYWMGKDPIGERVRVYGFRTPWMTVVGIVGDSMQKALENEAVPTLYRPFSQTVRRAVDSKESEAILHEIDYMHLAVRTTIQPEDLINAVQKRVWNLDPDQPALRIAKMENVMTKALELPRFNMFLVGVLAGVALLLAAVGIYGLVNYLTVQRMQEISIRIALERRSSIPSRVVT